MKSHQRTIYSRSGEIRNKISLFEDEIAMLKEELRQLQSYCAHDGESIETVDAASGCTERECLICGIFH